MPMAGSNAGGWTIDQDQAGNPVVRHSHGAAAIVAYVRRASDGSRHARCPDCGEEFEVPARDD
jgi:hypothetical protein